MKIAASVTPNKTKFGPLLYPGDIERGLKELSEMGYDGIELSLRTPDDMEKKVLFGLLEKYDMELLSIATGQSFIEDSLSLFSFEEGKRKETVRRIKGYIDLLSGTGGCVILGGIKGKLAGTDDKKQFESGSSAIAECLSHAEKAGAYLLLEAINRYETNFFNTVGSCHEYVLSMNSSHLRVLPDTYHMNIEESSIHEALKGAAEDVGAIHCADNNRLAPGMGHIDFRSILSQVKNFKNLKYIGVEVLPVPDSKTCAQTAIKTIRSCLNQEVVK
ncbi:MAG: sugar phosphate isomerase/epimerase family protein [Spirochaetia bacterium]|jgi:sugar phosphate isomerase/epimerase|nr:sugar phosphate isomerase/epimerase family protein [Spirochaetia bacterium]